MVFEEEDGGLWVLVKGGAPGDGGRHTGRTEPHTHARKHARTHADETVFSSWVLLDFVGVIQGREPGHQHLEEVGLRTNSVVFFGIPMDGQTASCIQRLAFWVGVGFLFTGLFYYTFVTLACPDAGRAQGLETPVVLVSVVLWLMILRDLRTGIYDGLVPW